jgi:DNA-binding transcriptional ArsR family regulator
MQALSDPCRLAIIRELLDAKGRALACNEVRLSISKATRSHHFEVLRAAGMIHPKMEGTKCMTSLRRSELSVFFRTSRAVERVRSDTGQQKYSKIAWFFNASSPAAI